jgi:hypothetical protein
MSEDIDKYKSRVYYYLEFEIKFITISLYKDHINFKTYLEIRNFKLKVSLKK